MSKIAKYSEPTPPEVQPGNSNGENMEAATGEDNGKNPLEIPEILAIVAGYISKVEDLKSVRVLNSKWKDETFNKWRDSAVFLINNETKAVLVQAFDSKILPPSPKSVKEKVAAKNDPFLLKDFPFKNYRLQAGFCWKVDLEMEFILREVIAPIAEYLDAGPCAFTGYLQNDPLELLLAYNLNIKELALTPLQGTWSDFNWTNHYFVNPIKTYSVRKLTLKDIGKQKKKSKNVLLFQNGFVSNDDAKNAYWIFVKRMPNLKVLHETSGFITCNILKAMINSANIPDQALIGLEDVTVLNSRTPMMLPKLLAEYFLMFQPPLKNLKVPLVWADCVPEAFFIQSLGMVQDTLSTLELRVDCRRLLCRRLASAFPEEAEFCLDRRHFPNLTHFKVVVDYPVKSKGRLITFNLNHLRRMPKLKEFFFGFKDPEFLPERVISSKVEISDPQGIQLGLEDEMGGLSDLKSFHFHRNMSKAAMQVLGKWATNLQSLETVFDEENFSAVGEAWPSLKTLKLLQGSGVSKDKFDFNHLMDVLDYSEKFSVDSDESTAVMRRLSLRKR